MSDFSLEQSSIADVVRQHALARNPARLAFGKHDAGSDYHGLWQQVEHTLGELRAVGLAPGQRVALSMSNTRETVVALLAIMQAGATLVPLYHRPGMRPNGKDYARIVAILRASGAHWLLTHQADVACHEAAVHAAGAGRVVAMEALFGEPAQLMATSARCESGAPAIIQFSSGSTAEPKGICLQHAQLLCNARGFAHGLGWTALDRGCAWLPLFHDLGLVGTLFSAFAVGSSLLLSSPRQFVMDPLGWLAQISRDRATVSLAPQFAFDLVLAKASVSAPEPGSLDLSEVRMLLNGAEQVDAAACDRFEAYFARYGLRPNVVQPGYGLAENGVGVSVGRRGSRRCVRHFDRRSLSDGRVELRSEATADTVSRVGHGYAVLGSQFLILSEDDHVLPEGAVGEIAIVGESTARAMLHADGSVHALPRVLRTGDQGIVYERELFIVGRVKEMVKRAGEAISPVDVEHCVNAHVAELGLVASFGYYDEHAGGEELVVIAEARQFRSPERCAELAAGVRAAVLREFRLPLRDVLIARPNTIPRTTSGKLRRLTLRDRYLRGELGAHAAGEGLCVVERSI